MKEIVVNKSCGNKYIPTEYIKYLGYEVFSNQWYELFHDDFDNIRENKQFIEWLKNNKDKIEHNWLEVVSIPDNAHYVISDYDGYETVYWSMAKIEIID